MQAAGLITYVNTIAARTKWLREKRGLSQAALAARAGVTQSTIGNIESGVRKHPRELLAIAAALDTYPQWLQSGKGPWDLLASGAHGVQEESAGYGAPMSPTMANLIEQLGAMLSAMTPMERTSIAALIERVIEDPGLAKDAAATAAKLAPGPPPPMLT